MGVQRIQACPNLVCFASLYKNNARYCGGDNHGLAHGNKKARNSVASIEPDHATLVISKKKSRIPKGCRTHAMVVAELSQIKSA